MSKRSLFITFAFMLGSFMGIAPASAGMSTLTQSVNVDMKAADATFTIDFAHTPDFFTTDMFNRPTDSFQVEIATPPFGSDPLANLTSIVRGDEIRFANALRIRNASPPDFTDPQSGPWGTVRGAVPYSVVGNQLTFTAPLSMLGAPDGKFVYHVFTESFGVTQAEATGHSAAVPLPPALSAALFTLGLAASFVMLRATLKRRAAFAMSTAMV